MTISAMVYLKPGVPTPTDPDWRTDVPVSPSKTFTEHWLPLAREAGLERVQTFPYGWNVPPEDFDDVIRELDTMAELAPAVLEPLVAEALVERIALLRDWLASLDRDIVAEVNIG